MSRAIVHSTQKISITLSVNVITTDDTGLHLAVVPLLSLGWLIMALWRFRQALNRIRFSLHRLAGSITERLTIAAKLLTIGFNSLAWGCL